MKIAFIGQKGIPTRTGGIERYVENLSIGLTKLNHEVFVYTRPNYTPKRIKKHQGVHLISMPSIHTKHLDTISHVFFATLHALFQNYDIIHYQNVGPALLSFIPRLLKFRTKIITTFHCLDRNHQKWGPFARFFLHLGEWAACKFPHKTITVSKTLRDYCYKKYHTKAEYIPNGATPFPKTPKTPEVLKKFNLEKGRYLLVVSRLVRHKGIHHLIRAFRSLKVNLKLVIVGSGAFTDDYVEKIKKLASGDNRIIFTGRKQGPDLVAFYQNCYFYVHPSESEGMSLSLLEAMSFSKAVLVSDIPENLEVAADAGLAFENKNCVDLQKKLKILIKQPDLVARLGDLAAEKVKKEYNWEKIITQTDLVYEKEKLNKQRFLKTSLQNT
ncbi:glycosyltransferase family 4 protein [Candidatus Falkowbacteria bacterium]|nr:glycosyltransferase family 4 protein [Candidatus Falkowbacteria bacterium]